MKTKALRDVPKRPEGWDVRRHASKGELETRRRWFRSEGMSCCGIVVKF